MSSPLPPLQPGDWTPTGWGVQHRIRRSDERWTELVCHTTIQPSHPDGKRRAGESSRCETARLNRGAEETGRCPRCAALPGLGPIVFAPRGEVRRSADGEVAVCTSDAHIGPGCLDRAAGRGWKLVTPEWAHQMYGWRGDWDVVAWETVGNVLDSAAGVARQAA